MRKKIFVPAILLMLLFAAAAMAQPKPHSAAGKTLSGKEIGYPVYPGSKYLEHSGSMAAPGWKSYIFTSNDSPEKIKAFYEKKTGKKPVLLKKDKQTVYFFPMKGKPPIADEYINVEPNSYGGSAKTIISITKKIKKGKK
ncbi:MAG: hypothetical protein M0Z59_08105 [Nitrospiraceae bacterium]|nr:hypothetical protein [Nitrospiraceae bacterium]